MRLELFTPDLSNRHEITHAISAQIEDPYNGIGKFTLVLPRDEYNAAIAQEEAILYCVDKDLAYEVAEVVSDTGSNQITLNGYTLNNRLERRTAATAATITNVETDTYAAVSANLRGLPVQMHAAAGLTETITPTTVYGDTLLALVMPVLDAVDLGQRAKLDYRTGTIVWEIYKGRDLTGGLKRVAFCEEQGTAPGLVIDQDISTYKNVCYCTAQYADGTEFVVQSGTATDADRREMWCDYSGDSQADGESNAAFAVRVAQYAALQLGSHLNRIGFTVDADDELGSTYKVGDLVSCVSLKSGLQFDARVTSATYSQDINGQKNQMTLGNPTLTILGG